MLPWNYHFRHTFSKKKKCSCDTLHCLGNLLLIAYKLATFFLKYFLVHEQWTRDNPIFISPFPNGSSISLCFF